MTRGRFELYLQARRRIDPSFDVEQLVSTLRFKVANGAVTPSLFAFRDRICGRDILWNVVDSDDESVPPLIGLDFMKPAGEMHISFVKHTIRLGDSKLYFRDEPGVPIVKIVNSAQARNPYPLFKAG